MQLGLKACGFALLTQQALAYPSLPPLYNGTENWDNLTLQKRQGLNVPDLRILPLGASITNGLKSTDKTGYRKWLRDQLRWTGFEVNMVGSLRDGRMNDDDNEGHSGFTVRQVHDKAVAQYRMKPNLVLINAGTNDCRLDLEGGTTVAYDSTPLYMERMVVDIFDNVPEVTIVLSGLFPHKTWDDCHKFLNGEYREIAERLAAGGRKIVFADLYTPWWEVDRDLPDGTHPNDYGYKKLASVFWEAIQRAWASDFLTAPLDNGLAEDATTAVCDKKPGEYDYSKKTQQGSGGDDGPYVHKGVAQGVMLTIGPVQLEHVGGTHYWADLDGDGVDELIWYYDPDDGAGYYRAYYNVRSGSPLSANFMLLDTCKPKGVRWGDVNADGIADFICIGPEGNMYVSLGHGGIIPKFTTLGLYFENPLPGLMTQENVRLGDIDGDGRLDYCLIAGNGDITCWRNSGTTDKGYWQRFYTVFTGKNMGDIDGVRLVDINGDHRADWLYVHDDGSVDTYINNRGHDKSLKPDWQNAGRTHAGMDKKGARDYIQFARLTDSGRADYIYAEPKRIGASVSRMDIELNWWRNDGSGGTRLKGDGVHYCDMDGDGLDDYVYVNPEGNIQIFLNKDIPRDEPWSWGDHRWSELRKVDRRYIRLADIDGDGKCDVIYLSEDGIGEVVSWYRNDYTGFSWRWTNMGGLPELGPCQYPDGVGLFDLAVRFADLNGDGRADYLCMEPNGRTYASVSDAEAGFRYIAQVKKPEGADRANIRWVDVNGDRKADMVWLHKYGGDTKVWYNEKMQHAPNTNSAMIWRQGNEAYRQSARGEAIHFANLRGTGRADMIDVTPRTAEATTWFSKACSGGGSGDDGMIYFPNLPEVEKPFEPGRFPRLPLFLAMGDSYSAGIGAGPIVPTDGLDDPGSCMRNQGAYSYQLSQSVPELKAREFAFLSCTGAVIKNMVSDKQHEHRKSWQLEMLKSYEATSYGWATLSLGGNDIGFSNVLKPCLIWEDKKACKEAREAADKALNDNKLPSDLKDVYRAILNTAQVPGFTLVVTGYARFFNAQGTWCDDKSLGIIESLPFLDYFDPLMTGELRMTLNNLVDRLNQVIAGAVEAVNAEYGNKHVRWFDIDPLFEGHRLCDVDPNDAPIIDHRDNAWFYTPWEWDDSLPFDSLSNVAETKLAAANDQSCPPEDEELDTELGIICRLLRLGGYFDDGTGTGTPPRDLPLPTWLKAFFMKMMHPEQPAHAAIAAGIKKSWEEDWGRFGPRLAS
ncbi:SGNH hydrolase-type esterase domain-containing protein [Aspergillus californicus]